MKRTVSILTAALFVSALSRCRLLRRGVACCTGSGWPARGVACDGGTGIFSPRLTKHHHGHNHHHKEAAISTESGGAISRPWHRLERAPSTRARGLLKPLSRAGNGASITPFQAANLTALSGNSRPDGASLTINKARGAPGRRVLFIWR